MSEPAADPSPEAILAALRSRLGLPSLEFARTPEPITGGFETRIYSLRLAGAPPELSGDLVLRIYRRPGDSRNARVEFDVYSVLAAAGIPGPRAYHICDDSSLLGGPWILMDLVPGRPFIRAVSSPRMLYRAGAIMAETHARLHAVDATPLAGRHPDLAARAAPPSEHFREQATAYRLDGLRPGIDWLEAKRPPPPDRAALVHGDFHPVNIMFHKGAVSGVIDWSNASIGDPAFDVAVTRFILVRGPAEAAGAARFGLELIRRMIARRYVRRYRKLRPLDSSRLDYFEAVRIMMALISAAEKRERGESVDPYPWDLPGMAEMLRARFKQLTGVPLA